jgi:hypothetical protein
LRIFYSKKLKEKGEGRMNSKLSKAIMMLLAAMLLVSVIPAFAQPYVPHNANAIWLEDNNVPYWAVNLTTANPLHTLGYKFRVTAYINWSTLEGAAVGISAWQVVLYYNTAILNVTGAGFTADGGAKSQLFSGHSTTPSIKIEPDKKRVGCGETLFGADYVSVPVVASLCWIEFNVTAVPTKTETLLTDTFDITNDLTYVLDNLSTKYTGCGNDGYYEFKWERPPPAHMAVEHDGSSVWPLVYGPWPPPAVGQTFNAEIYIEDLAAAWGLTSASFCLCYNTTVIDVVGGLANVTLNDAVWDTTTSEVEIVHGEPDEIWFLVYPDEGVVPSGKVLVATVTFTIMLQSDTPPYPFGYYDSSPLDFCDVALEDHVMPIDTAAPENGEVRVIALAAIPIPWLEVSPVATVLGPDPSIGDEFDVDIIIKNLHPAWKMIAYQVRVTYDPTLLSVVSVTEGPFMTDPRWNLHGTFFTSGIKTDGTFGPHVYFGGILMPPWDMTQWPQAPGPDVPNLYPLINPIIATIRFRCVSQPISPSPAESCRLDIPPTILPEDHHFMDVDGGYIPTATDKIVNGTYTILPRTVGEREIDVYGGAVNRGYGTEHGTTYNGGVVWPEPYGGQGPDAPMDLVIPQSVVYLFAYVTYNAWPVQSKDVGYEVEGPFDHDTGEPRNSYFVRKYSARTDSNGIAMIDFQMPWPCDNPEDLFGVYKVTATVDICGEVVDDTLLFDYYYLVEITKVTTDKEAYAHCNNVKVTVEFRSKAQQYYPVLFSVVIQDELKTHFGSALYETEVGGAQFCTWKPYIFTVAIHVEKWAFAGIAKIYVSAYDKDPTDGGAPWCPTYGLGWPPGKTVPEIIILPL